MLMNSAPFPKINLILKPANEQIHFNGVMQLSFEKQMQSSLRRLMNMESAKCCCYYLTSVNMMSRLNDFISLIYASFAFHALALATSLLVRYCSRIHHSQGSLGMPL